MIDQSKIAKVWIEHTAKKYKADPAIVEKVIHALLLLEGLAESNIELVFKGGTALMLHYDSAKRLSVDIDVLMKEKPENLDSILQNIVNNKGFTKVESQKRNPNSSIQKAHYKFYYTSPFYNEEQNVILDIVFEPIDNKETVRLDIQSYFVPEEGAPIDVRVASIESLLGDKLTAFAPNTTGIPYERSDNDMSMEIIKQLYDIGNLFDDMEDMEKVKQSFQRTVEVQLAYNNLDTSNNTIVHDDTQNTALTIMSREVLGGEKFKELQNGIKRLKNYIYSEAYRIDQAIISAAKAAYLSEAIRMNEVAIERYSTPEQIADWNIENPDYNKLNKLKKSNPEAFFYGYQWLILKNEVE